MSTSKVDPPKGEKEMLLTSSVWSSFFTASFDLPTSGASDESNLNHQTIYNTGHQDLGDLNDEGGLGFTGPSEPSAQSVAHEKLRGHLFGKSQPNAKSAAAAPSKTKSKHYQKQKESSTDDEDEGRSAIVKGKLSSKGPKKINQKTDTQLEQDSTRENEEEPRMKRKPVVKSQGKRRTGNILDDLLKEREVKKKRKETLPS